MNTPNKLTLMRVVLIPVFMAVLYLLPDTWNYIVGAAVFIIASLTDMLDGRLARKNNQVTDLGKFLDPLADKLLVFAALFCLVDFKVISVFTAMRVVAREMMVTSLRLVAAGKDGTVIAAGKLGKLKTVFQMVAISSFFLDDILLGAIFPSLQPGSHFIAYPIWIIAIAFTVISGVDYFMKYKKFLFQK